MTLIGKAWRAIQRSLQDARIAADFPRYETAQLASHEAEADRRFDTAQLQREIDEIRQAAELLGQTVYRQEIQRTRSSVDALEPLIANLQAQQILFRRDYRQELDNLRGDKERMLAERYALSDERKSLHKKAADVKEALSEAYEQAEDAQSSIESWHSKSTRSPWLFGNGGKQIPEHSIFGQSFGDLNDYKASRSEAGAEIASCKADLVEIRNKLQANRTRIVQNTASLAGIEASVRAVKVDRDRMFTLKNQGIRAHHVAADLANHHRQDAALRLALDQLITARDALVAAHSCRMGIDERRQTATVLRNRHAEFMAAFNAPEQRAARKRMHREWWLSHHTVP